MKDNENVLHPNEATSQRVQAYSHAHSTPIPSYLSDFHAQASNHPRASYMISTNQAAWQIWMAKALGAKRILEIGCFIGFSAMGWSEAVGKDGHVTTLEFDAGYAEEARAAWAANGITNVEVIVGDAKETLKKLATDTKEPYDLVFIDADKTSYPTYLQTLLDSSLPGSRNRLLRSGGVILADNILRRGLVADDSDDNPWSRAGKLQAWQSSDLDALRKFNGMMVKEERLETFLLALFDGVGMARLKD